jgi:hypothetical protein
MRSLLSRVGLRGALAAGAALLVLAVIGIAKLTVGDRQPIRIGTIAEPTSTIDPTAGDDGDVPVTPSAYPDEGTVLATATAFATAWLRHGVTAANWHLGVAKLATGSLTKTLDGVDPGGVPATRVTGHPTVVMRGELYAQVSIAVDTGTLLLGLVKQGNRWLVDTVDWGRT